MNWLKENLFFNLNQKSVSYLKFSRYWEHLGEEIGLKLQIWKNTNQTFLNSLLILPISRDYHLRVKNGCSGFWKQIHRKEWQSLKHWTTGTYKNSEKIKWSSINPFILLKLYLMKVYKHNQNRWSFHLILKRKWLILLTIPIVATVPPTIANILTAKLYKDGSYFL